MRRGCWGRDRRRPSARFYARPWRRLGAAGTNGDHTGGTFSSGGLCERERPRLLQGAGIGDLYGESPAGRGVASKNWAARANCCRFSEFGTGPLALPVDRAADSSQSGKQYILALRNSSVVQPRPPRTAAGFQNSVENPVARRLPGHIGGGELRAHLADQVDEADRSLAIRPAPIAGDPPATTI
jgi:hypothetical protein